ncbi:DUF2493 domain-containing protein [Nitrobacteraceae bacterium UC4446_H13]
MTRVLVCGGRDYVNGRRLRFVLDHYNDGNPFSAVIHGAARGADTLASEWASNRSIPALPFPADWDNHGRSAGHIRNAQMLREGKPDVVIAFPGGRGTDNMIDQATRAGVPVLRIPAG